MASYNPAIEEGKDIELPLSAGNKRRIANLQVYCYDEMIKRLNSVDKGKGGSVGYLLRRLWKRHESGLVMHDNFIYGEQHEQSQKANRSKFEKDHKKGEIGFRKDASGVWGVYSDWLYDTYQKDWSKAYQLTFWCFFRNMDYLSNPRDGEFFSYVHRKPVFRFVNPDGSIQSIPYTEKHQFGKIIIKDAENLLGSSSKLNAVHALPKHDKAVLYDILYGVACYKGGSEEEIEPFMNGYGYWLGSACCSAGGFPKMLSMDAFAHMASAAVVNAKALDAVKAYLPNSYKAFTNILKVMVLRLESRATDAYYMEPKEFKDLFYSFLSDCFPFRGSGDRVNFDKFIKGIYGGNVSAAKLDSLHSGVIGNSMPRPNSIEIKQMSANILGAYKGYVIYINRQIVSDSIWSQEACFILLLVLLHEYGHFLDEFLNPGGGGNSDDEKGKAFTERFMKHSAADLFRNSFDFADFKAADDRGYEHVLRAKISSLDEEQRMGIFSFFEYSEYQAGGDLELPNGEIISNAEFFSLDAHRELTLDAARLEGIADDFNRSLRKGSVWQDIGCGLAMLYGSHKGENQHWHSMCPKLSSTPTNEEVKGEIIKQARKWYEDAIKYKKAQASLLNLGRLCHMVQDGYCLSHCWRRYTWDTDIIQLLLQSGNGINRITLAENGQIWDFQDYKKQDDKYHDCADESTQEYNGTQNPPPVAMQTIGYASAKNATREIIRRYRKELGFYQDEPGLGSLEYYLRHKVYVIYSGRENKDSGNCHPLFLERLGSNIDDVKYGLYRLSDKNQGI